MSKLGDKETLRLSGSTVFRCREPTNPHTADKFTNMIWDYSRQNAVVPSKGFSQLRADQSSRTTNRTGSPMSLNVMVGGSPDTAGRTDAKMSFTSPPPRGGRIETPPSPGRKFARRKGT